MFVTTPIINFIPWQERQTGAGGVFTGDAWMFGCSSPQKLVQI